MARPGRSVPGDLHKSGGSWQLQDRRKFGTALTDRRWTGRPSDTNHPRSERDRTWTTSSSYSGPSRPPLAGAVIDAVEREDVNYLSGLVTASTAVIVESRQAIQIPGCDGESIVGHVPVGDALMASLRVAVSNLTDL